MCMSTTSRLIDCRIYTVIRRNNLLALNYGSSARISNGDSRGTGSAHEVVHSNSPATTVVSSGIMPKYTYIASETSTKVLQSLST